MAPAVWWMYVATPELSCWPRPTLVSGQVFDGAVVPIFATQAGAVLIKNASRSQPGPEESARWTATIGRFGRLDTPETLAISGSSQLVIVPSKIPASVGPSSFRFF